MGGGVEDRAPWPRPPAAYGLPRTPRWTTARHGAAPQDRRSPARTGPMRAAPRDGAELRRPGRRSSGGPVAGRTPAGPGSGSARRGPSGAQAART